MNSLYLPTSCKKQIVIVTAHVMKEKIQAFKQFLLLIFTPVLGLSQEATAHLLEIRVLFCCHLLLLLFVEKALINPAPHVQSWNSDHSTIMRLLLLSTDACCNNRTNIGQETWSSAKIFWIRNWLLDHQKDLEMKAKIFELHSIGNLYGAC